jgi:hypothetical protein
VNRGSRRLLLKTLKWVFIPLGLVVAGYFLVGPFVSDYVNESKLDAKVQSRQK